MESQDKEKDTFDYQKKYGLRRIRRSIVNSIHGIITSYKEEQSLWIHLIMSMVVFICGIIFQIRRYDIILSMILMGMVLCVELLNTAIEANVDLTVTKIHPLAKKAKDIGSAATFMMSIFAFIGELLIFYPYIIDFFK